MTSLKRDFDKVLDDNGYLSLKFVDTRSTYDRDKRITTLQIPAVSFTDEQRAALGSIKELLKIEFGLSKVQAMSVVEDIKNFRIMSALMARKLED